MEGRIVKFQNKLWVVTGDLGDRAEIRMLDNLDTVQIVGKRHLESVKVENA